VKDVREAKFSRPDPQLLAELKKITVATACGCLMKLGYRNTYMMGGINQLVPGLKVVGPAVTLRYLPMREDLSVTPEERPNLADFQAIEALGEGDVLVADVYGDCGGSTIGDVIATRMLARKAAGFVADGAIRDLPFLKDMQLPVFAKGIHASPGPRAIWPADFNLPIRCGGVLVLPGDIIIGDEDGVVAIPKDLLPKVVEMGLEEEDLEHFVKGELIAKGTKIGDYYPPSQKTLEAARAARKG
jgi:regulator of RNase E activity RraA